MNIHLPEHVSFIINTFYAKGKEAFVVGGCVRDSLMGKTPSDWDICTQALPEETMQYFQGYKVLLTGLQHGTVTLILEGKQYEITTYRVDGAYQDGRHPVEVLFTSNIENDLARRDFTVNAIAYSPINGLVDLFGGMQDIQRQTIRCVGKAQTRFQEDALRIMRALRFGSVLGFTIEPQTSAAILMCKAMLSKVAIERVQVEFRKLIQGGNSTEILLRYQEVFGLLIPEIVPLFGFGQNSPYHVYDVWQHTVKAVAAAPSVLPVRLALFFHDIAKPECYTQDEKGDGHFYKHAVYGAKKAEQIMKRMRFSNELVHKVKTLVLYHDAEIANTDKSVLRWLNKMGESDFRLLLEVKKADSLAQAPWWAKQQIPAINAITKRVDAVIEKQVCFQLKDLAVTGNDLINAGMQAGPLVGDTLKELLHKVMGEELENDRQKLLEYMQKSMLE